MTTKPILRDPRNFAEHYDRESMLRPFDFLAPSERVSVKVLLRRFTVDGKLLGGRLIRFLDVVIERLTMQDDNYVFWFERRDKRYSSFDHLAVCQALEAERRLRTDIESRCFDVRRALERVAA